MHHVIVDRFLPKQTKIEWNSVTIHTLWRCWFYILPYYICECVYLASRQKGKHWKIHKSCMECASTRSIMLRTNVRASKKNYWKLWSCSILLLFMVLSITFRRWMQSIGDTDERLNQNEMKIKKILRLLIARTHHHHQQQKHRSTRFVPKRFKNSFHHVHYGKNSIINVVLFKI